MNQYAFVAGVAAGEVLAEHNNTATDVMLWRETEGDHYSPTISVTAAGRVAINVGGTVYEKTLKEWHDLAGGPYKGGPIE